MNPQPPFGQQAKSILGPWLSSPLGRLLLIGTAALIAAAILIPAFGVTRMMSPASDNAATQAQFQGTPVGSSLTAALRLDSHSGNSYQATLLEKQNETTYRVTVIRITVELGSDIQVVMGSKSDLKDGGVVQVDGVLSTAQTIMARRAVILTGFVQLKG